MSTDHDPQGPAMAMPGGAEGDDWTTLAEAMDLLQVGVAVFDADLRLIHWNRKLVDLFDYPPSLYRRHTPFAAFIRHNAECGEYGPGDIETQVAERVALARRFLPHRFERVRPNGQVVAIEGHPLPRGGFMTTYTDLTGQRQAEDKLRTLAHELDAQVQARTTALERQNTYLRTLTDHLPLGVTIVDGDMRLVAVNQFYCDLLDMPVDLCRPGVPFEALMRFNARRGEYGPGPVDTIVAQRMAIARAREPHHFERHRPDGRVVEIRGNPIPGGGFISTYTDVTERHRHAEVLRAITQAAMAASRAKSDFLASMSHELRTPLNAVIGFAQMLEGEVMGAIGQPVYRDYAGFILGAATHLLDLINDLLDLSRIEAGRYELAETPLSLDREVADVRPMLADAASRAGVGLAFDLAAGLPWVRADRRALRQVLLNVIGNAIKFTPPGGRVRVAAALATDGLDITVADTGRGIAPEDIARVLEPFTQVNPTVAREGGGVGLGLAICRSLTDLHGGRLTLDSTLGQGTTVRIHLPAERLVGAPEEALP